MPKKLTIQEIQKYINENAEGKCILLSTEYKNSSTPLLFQCQCGKTFERDWQHFSRKRYLCPECSKKIKNENNPTKFSIKDVQDYIKENDINQECELLSTEYINSKTPLTLRCNLCGEIFTRDFSHIKRGRFRCEKCGEVIGAKKLVYSLEDVQQDIAKDGYTIIGEYVNASTGVLCQCSNKNHKPFYLYYSEYKFRGRGCPMCGIEKISGENHWNWQGGISFLNDELRNAINPWKFDIFNNSPFCDITGSTKDLEVHHININYSDLVKEAIKNVNFNLKGIYRASYSYEEIAELKQEILRLHYEKAQGVVLTKEIHQEFHSIYGKENNTIEQYLEFKERKQKEL